MHYTHYGWSVFKTQIPQYSLLPIQLQKRNEGLPTKSIYCVTICIGVYFFENLCNFVTILSINKALIITIIILIKKCYAAPLPQWDAGSSQAIPFPPPAFCQVPSAIYFESIFFFLCKERHCKNTIVLPKNRTQRSQPVLEPELRNPLCFPLFIYRLR